MCWKPFHDQEQSGFIFSFFCPLNKIQLKLAASALSLPSPWQDISSVLASSVPTVSNLLSLPFLSLEWMTLRVLGHCIDKEIKTKQEG